MKITAPSIAPFAAPLLHQSVLDVPADAAAGRPIRAWTPSPQQLENIAASTIDTTACPFWTPEKLESDPRSPVYGRSTRALANYETWYKLPVGSATIEQVKASSAGVHGWSTTDFSLDLDDTALAVADSTALADEPPFFIPHYLAAYSSKWDECAAAADDVVAKGQTEPRSYNEAVANDDAPDWIKAVESEIASHVKNGTFGEPITKEELRTKGLRSVPLGDVFKLKRCGRKKYRIVVRGYLLRAGIEFNETFAPITYITTLRLLLALATKFNWEIKQGDVGTAFLCTDLDTEIYITMPKAVLAHNKAVATAEAEGKTVYRLLKGVPGIPQGSRLFSKKSHGILAGVGFTRSKVDHALYIAPNNIYLVVWVDDLFLFFPTEQAAVAGRMWQGLQAELDLGKWSDIDDCLGCKI